MFNNHSIDTLNIIVINQTTENKRLVSSSNNIKVYNSQDVGLSKSRNLAITKATKSLLLIADDDVVFTPNFAKHIVSAYNENKDADSIIFQTQTPEGALFRHYSQGLLGKTEVKHALSIEISFKRNFIELHHVLYDELFGLGAQFSDTENVHFLNALIDNGAKIYGVAKTIVTHNKCSSSDAIASKRLAYARGASFYKRFGHIAYLYIVKYVFFLWRKGYITLSEIKTYSRVMLKAVKDYKSIIKNES